MVTLRSAWRAGCLATRSAQDVRLIPAAGVTWSSAPCAAPVTRRSPAVRRTNVAAYNGRGTASCKLPSYEDLDLGEIRLVLFPVFRDKPWYMLLSTFCRVEGRSTLVPPCVRSGFGEVYMFQYGWCGRALQALLRHRRSLCFKLWSPLFWPWLHLDPEAMLRKKCRALGFCIELGPDPAGQGPGADTQQDCRCLGRWAPSRQLHLCRSRP